MENNANLAVSSVASKAVCLDSPHRDRQFALEEMRHSPPESIITVKFTGKSFDMSLS